MVYFIPSPSRDCVVISKVPISDRGGMGGRVMKLLSGNIEGNILADFCPGNG